MSTPGTNTIQNRILLVDDDPIVVNSLQRGLSKAGYQVDVRLDGKSALSSFRSSTPDLAIVDVMLPDILGTDLAARMLDMYYRPIIILSGHSDADIVNAAIGNGVFGYLVKPLSAEQLVPSIETALARYGEFHRRIADHLGEPDMDGTPINDLLDRFSMGLIIVDDRHNILYQNKAAHSLTSAAGLIVNNGGRLAAARSHHSAAFKKSLQTALGQHGAPGMGAMTLEDASGRTLQIWTKPLLEDSSAHLSYALVTILDLDQPMPAPEPLLKALYGLTVKECRLVAALVNGQTIDQYCASSFISPNTARTHLKAIYRKTNTHRQVDLIRLRSRLLVSMGSDMDTN